MKVSIIIPVYNVEKYIEKCLNSVINQTYKNIEILIIIDGSNDNSETIVNKFSSKDDRINIIKRENRGLLATRIEGIKKSKGQYIVFVDSDDWIELDMIEKLLNIAILEKSDIVKCSYIRENIERDIKINATPPFKSKTTIDGNYIISKLYPLMINTYHCNSCCFEIIKKSKIGNLDIDTSIAMGEDLLLNIQLYKNINRITFIPDNLYHYRFNQSSISKSLDYNKIEKRVFDVIHVYSQLYYFCKVNNKINRELYKNISARIITEASNQLSLLFFNKSNINTQKEIINRVINSAELNNAIDEVSISYILKSKNQYSKILTILIYKKLNKMTLIYGNNIYILIRKLRRCIRLILNGIKTIRK